MEKGFFASSFSLYGSDDYVKIDFFEMEPITDEDGKVIEQKGIVQRITLPKKTASKLALRLNNLKKS